MNILITGGRGFIGRNLIAHLGEIGGHRLLIIDQEDSEQQLQTALLAADLIYHLAGVNRPQDQSEFETGNTGLTATICNFLLQNKRKTKIVFSSSMQAAFDNPYGVSKARAEDALREYAAQSGAVVRIYRLKNLFGKWCRPNYNSVTATFCYNIANGLPIALSDPSRELELSYIDDVVAVFLEEIGGTQIEREAGALIPAYKVTLGMLANRIQALHDCRKTLRLPDCSDPFIRALYATYQSYLPVEALEYQLEQKRDLRGSLAEFIKSDRIGQIFVSRTKPGISRGNHYHHTKLEKFFVLEGEALIQLRAIDSSEVKEFRVAGDAYQVIDIPPGYTHCITNTGSGELVTLFWTSECFDPNRTDTHPLLVNAEVTVG